MKLTASAKKIIETGIGYRCEEQSTGYHEPLDILDYEINELGNNDILDTMDDLYNLDTDDIAEIDHFIKSAVKDDYDLIWLAADPLDTIEFYSDGHQQIASVKDAKHSDGTPIEITRYLLPTQNILLISDCGVDGQLFAYPSELELSSEIIN